jgi:hypothetical protein
MIDAAQGAAIISICHKLMFEIGVILAPQNPILARTKQPTH